MSTRHVDFYMGCPVNDDSLPNNNRKKLHDMCPSLYPYSEAEEAIWKKYKIKKIPFVQITKLSSAEITNATARSPLKEPVSYLLSEEDFSNLNLSTIMVTDENVDTAAMQRITSIKKPHSSSTFSAEKLQPRRQVTVQDLLTEMKAKLIGTTKVKMHLKQVWTNAFASSRNNCDDHNYYKARSSPSAEKVVEPKRMCSDAELPSKKRPKVDNKKVYKSRLANRQCNHSSNDNFVKIPTDVLATYTGANLAPFRQPPINHSISMAFAIKKKSPFTSSSTSISTDTKAQMNSSTFAYKHVPKSPPVIKCSSKTTTTGTQTNAVVVTDENFHSDMYDSVDEKGYHLLSELPEACDPLNNIFSIMKVVKALTEKVKQYKNRLENEREEVIERVRKMYNIKLHAIGEEIGKQETLFCDLMQQAMHKGHEKDEPNDSLCEEIKLVLQPYKNHIREKERNLVSSAPSNEASFSESPSAQLDSVTANGECYLSLESPRLLATSPPSASPVVISDKIRPHTSHSAVHLNQSSSDAEPVLQKSPFSRNASTFLAQKCMPIECDEQTVLRDSEKSAINSTEPVSPETVPKANTSNFRIHQRALSISSKSKSTKELSLKWARNHRDEIKLYGYGACLRHTKNEEERNRRKLLLLELKRLQKVVPAYLMPKENPSKYSILVTTQAYFNSISQDMANLERELKLQTRLRDSKQSRVTNLMHKFQHHLTFEDLNNLSNM